jgi:osmotically-inducible protein OsmY
VTSAVSTGSVLVGVRNVLNEIEIRNDADPAAVALNVQDALDRYSLVPEDSDVHVATEAHQVTLSA